MAPPLLGSPPARAHDPHKPLCSWAAGGSLGKKTAGKRLPLQACPWLPLTRGMTQAQCLGEETPMPGLWQSSLTRSLPPCPPCAGVGDPYRSFCLGHSYPAGSFPSEGLCSLAAQTPPQHVVSAPSPPCIPLLPSQQQPSAQEKSREQINDRSWLHLSLPPEGAFQVVLMVENLPAGAGDVRDVGSIPGSGRSPGGGHGNPLQYSCLENPMDRGAWRATFYEAAKRWTCLKRLSTHTGT